MGTDDYAETGATSRFIFIRRRHAPRDELNTAADAIRAALREGVTVQDVVLIPEDDITCDADGETLTVMLRLTWIETAEETGDLWRIWYMVKVTGCAGGKSRAARKGPQECKTV